MNFDNNIPIYVQVVNKIKQDLVTGKLKTGEKILSTREFATEISLNINTVARVYKHIEQEGIVETRRGLGTFVVATPEKIKEIRNEMANSLIEEFVKGMTEIGYSEKDVVKMLVNNNKGEIDDE